MPDDESLGNQSDWGKSFCHVCGKQLDYWSPDKTCLNCWEVEHRIAEYAKSDKGREFLYKYSCTPPIPPPSFTPSGNLIYVVHDGPDAIQVFQIKSDAEACARDSKEHTVKEIDLRFLDDWPHPDDWDYEAILKEYEVEVVWSDMLIDGEGRTFPDYNPGWTLTWKRGCIWIGNTKEEFARKAAAIFVSLWQRGVSASLANKLMDGYLSCLELQENKSMTFLVDALDQPNPLHYLCLTRENFCNKAQLGGHLEWRILDALGPVDDDEEIICTFTKWKK